MMYCEVSLKRNCDCHKYRSTHGHGLNWVQKVRKHDGMNLRSETKVSSEVLQYGSKKVPTVKSYHWDQQRVESISHFISEKKDQALIQGDPLLKKIFVSILEICLCFSAVCLQFSKKPTSSRTRSTCRQKCLVLEVQPLEITDFDLGHPVWSKSNFHTQLRVILLFSINQTCTLVNIK